MAKVPSDITLLQDPAGISIEITYSDIELEDGVEIVKVLLERYEVPKEEDVLNKLKDVVFRQQVLQYLGGKTAYMSSVFGMGGGDLSIDPDLIDITLALDNEYPRIVDTGIDQASNFYLYRIITYGSPDFEMATRYVAGLDTFEADIKNVELIEAEYVKFLDSADIEKIFPDNVDGLLTWANEGSFFHETYRLRSKGEYESFKFSTFWQRAWMGIHYLKTMLDITEQEIDGIRSVVDVIHTKSS